MVHCMTRLRKEGGTPGKAALSTSKGSSSKRVLGSRTRKLSWPGRRSQSSSHSTTPKLNMSALLSYASPRITCHPEGEVGRGHNESENLDHLDRVLRARLEHKQALQQLDWPVPVVL